MRQFSEGPSVRAHGDDWWRGCVIYEVYLRSFQDTSGTGVGDLAGVIERLSYIASLGVDAIWLTPFFASPMEDMGYDVADYCAVDPIFGTMRDFDRLVEEAHRLGLKVMIDQVLSHSSDQHPWFTESRSSRDNPRADWYVWADAKPDGSPPSNWLSVFGGSAWQWDTGREQYYLHNFLVSQPDLNFHAPAVQDAVLETVRFWLERGVDAFRLDAVNYYFHDRRLRDNPPMPDEHNPDVPAVNPYGDQNHVHDKTQPENLIFLRRLRSLLDSYGGRPAIGEIGDGHRSLATVAAYTAGRDMLQMCYTFDLLAAEFSPAHIRKCVDSFEAAASDGWVCWAFSNHDVERHVSRFSGPEDDAGRVAKFALTLLATLRGSICLYQGEELGLTEAQIGFEDLRDPYGIRFWPDFKGRDGCRTPMVWEELAVYAGFSEAKPWLPISEEHRRRAVSVQEYDPNSVLTHYRAILGWRRQHAPLVRGDIRFLASDESILAYLRQSEDETILCLFNFSRQAQEFDPAEWQKLDLLDLPGVPAPRLRGKRVRLEGLAAAFARVA